MTEHEGKVEYGLRAVGNGQISNTVEIAWKSLYKISLKRIEDRFQDFYSISPICKNRK
ncbi:hypothetical protein LEP1GSC047_0961 [Leptospira inadai serovar Lyme str. 10]|uniref:Uncharacterized protein n=1 Tax=Leptospira inadai serovar Lyme str. 10 TaxID=1049790 RepID=V6HSJ8_9LEPT|nr:hypothetical protein LEP1GSC047_0961 [Leptospira inadai serovar Lyme str. 10]